MRWVRKDPTTLLLALIESGFGDRPAASLRAEFPAAVDHLRQIGALKQSSTLRTVCCRACDQDHDAAVKFTLAGNARHFCPEAGWVDDSGDDLATLRLDPEWLLDWLERALSVLAPRRRRVLLTDRIWHIGETVRGRTSVTIMFSRGFVRAAELSAALARVPPTELGILLTTAAEVPTEILANHRYCAVNLDQILLPQADGLVIHPGRFAGLIRALARKTKPMAGRGGRYSEATLILEVFRARRTRKAPYRSKSAEAKDIIAEWPDHHPDVDPPGYSTIRRYLPDRGQ
jgi:hypothetical protein